MNKTNQSNISREEKELLAVKIVLISLIGAMGRQLGKVLVSSIPQCKNVLNEIAPGVVLPEDIEEIIEIAKQMVPFQ